MLKPVSNSVITESTMKTMLLVLEWVRVMKWAISGLTVMISM